MRFLAAITQDIRFQFRHGFYYVYGILTLIYIILLQLLPDQWVQPTLTLILFVDICTLGFFFVGAIVLLERGQNIMESIFVTPLLLREYLFSKQLSFLILSCVSALLIVLGAGSQLNDMFWFLVGLILSSSLFTFFGLAFATKARHVNDYFVRSLGLGLLLSLPLVAYLNLFDSALFYLFPAKATLILLDVLAVTYSSGEKFYAAVSLLVWTIFLAYMAYGLFEKHVRHPA